MSIRARLHIRPRTTVTASVLAGALVLTSGAAVTWADHDDEGTIHLCVSTAGTVREAAPPCRANETARVLVTEGGLSRLADELRSRIAALHDADGGLSARIDALSGADTTLRSRIDALESNNTSIDGRLDALEAADQGLATRLDALEDRVAALELAVARAAVTFTKVHDGGHYASYTVSGTGFDPGSSVTSGVGTSTTVSPDGTFSLFGGNLFCDRDVTVTGTDVHGAPVTRSAPVECNSETVSVATATFTKIHDGGHYASYSVTGTGFRAGSTVTSGVGTTATVADDGTFDLFGGNLFCDDQVSVSGVDAAGNTVSRFEEVLCNNE